MGKFFGGVLVGFGAFFMLSAYMYGKELNDHGISNDEDHMVDELIKLAGHNRESVMNVIGPDGEILKSVTFVRND